MLHNRSDVDKAPSAYFCISLLLTSGQSVASFKWETYFIQPAETYVSKPAIVILKLHISITHISIIRFHSWGEITGCNCHFGLLCWHSFGFSSIPLSLGWRTRELQSLTPSAPSSITGCCIPPCRSPGEPDLPIRTSSPAHSAGTSRGGRLMSWAAPRASPARRATTPSSTWPSAGCAARSCAAAMSASASGSASGTALATAVSCAGAGGSPRVGESRSCFVMIMTTTKTIGRDN